MFHLLLDANEPLDVLADKLNALGPDGAMYSAALSINRAILAKDLNTVFVFVMAYALATNFQMTERVGSDFVTLATQNPPPALDS